MCERVCARINCTYINSAKVFASCFDHDISSEKVLVSWRMIFTIICGCFMLVFFCFSLPNSFVSIHILISWCFYSSYNIHYSIRVKFPYLVRRKVEAGQEIRRVAQLDWKIIENDCKKPFVASGLEFVPLPVSFLTFSCSWCNAHKCLLNIWYMFFPLSFLSM